jgi:hypothetical protein
MKPRRIVESKHSVFRASLACIVLIMGGSLTLQSGSQFASTASTQLPTSTTRPLFPCLQSLDEMLPKARVAVLHGPDWILESSIRPSCFPERDVVFAARVGEGLIRHPFTAKTRMWVTRNHEVTHIRIVTSSGSRERDNVAVSFVTNHKCIGKSSRNCSVKGGAVLMPID